MTTAGAPAAPPPMTAEELLELPDDGFRHELIEGELQTTAPAGGQHGRVALKIGRRVADFVEAEGLGHCFGAETGFYLRRNPDTVRAPDLAFVPSEDVSAPSSVGFLTEVPDLVVEVVSPSDRASEVIQKALVWLDFGVRLVWVIDPRARLVTVHRPGDVIGLVRGDAATLEGEDVLPGFRVTLADLFA